MKKNLISKFIQFKMRKKSSILIFLFFFSIFVFYNSNSIPNTKQKQNSQKLSKLIESNRIVAKNEKFKNYSVLSVDFNTKLDWYVFYIPIVALAWRKIGFETIVLSVNSTEIKKNSSAAKTIEYLNLINIKIIHVNSVVGYEKMTGMLSRLLIGWIDCIDDDAFVFTTDSDVIPIRKMYFNIENRDSILLLDAFHFGSFNYKNIQYKHYSMQYTGMKKDKWKTIVQSQDDYNYNLNGASALKLVELMFGPKLIKKSELTARGDDTWLLDQHILSIKIGNYLKENPKQKYFEKHYNGLKLDRSNSDNGWNSILNFKWDKIIDSHLLHENYISKMSLLIALFEKILSNDEMLIIDKYIKEFIKIKLN
jgi:hypothetical protein